MDVRLIAFRPELAVPFFEWRNQRASRRHNPLMPMSFTDIRKMLASEGSDLSELKRYTSFRWFIEAGGEPVGSVSLKNISRQMGLAEIGYGVAEAHQGRGIATRAVRLLVDKVFRETSLRKIIALVHDQNVPSCRLLERLGFTREGLLREHYVIEGVPVNEILFGLLSKEWAAAGSSGATTT